MSDLKSRLLNKIHMLFIELALGFAGMLIISGCGRQQGEDGTPVYYLNTDETKLEVHYKDINTDESVMLMELIEALGEVPEKLQYKAPLASMGFELIGAELTEERLILNFDSDYNSMNPATEVLVRAAIVKTLCQCKSVSKVYFYVDGAPLTDNKGISSGPMNAETFIYNDGNAINTYEEVQVKLYFANEDGTGIIGAVRDKFYSTNIPLELFVVEEIIAGPSGSIAGLYPTVNSDTKIISVATSDEICYVNLDQSFLLGVGNVSTELSIASIVNSLVELPGIEKVHIQINGEVPASFTKALYEYNPDVITTLFAKDNEEENTEANNNDTDEE